MYYPATNGVFQIDKEDLPLISVFNWNINNNGYVQSTNRIRPIRIYAHRLIMGFPKKIIDHKNGITIDNRRINLKEVSTRQNAQNRKSHRAGRLVGAYWSKLHNKWRAQIILNGKKKHLGLFNTELEAHKEYLKNVPE